MARIRTIKPEALKDGDLWDLEQSTGFPIFRAFVGMLCQADRDGRFVWKPRELKTDVLPYWDGDFSDVLNALADGSFVIHYEVEGRQYGQIVNFAKHQTINNRESVSKLPQCPGSPIIPETSARVPHACPTRHDLAQGEGKGREGKGREDPSDACPTRRPGEGEDPAGDDVPPKPTPWDWRAWADAFREITGRQGDFRDLLPTGTETAHLQDMRKIVGTLENFRTHLDAIMAKNGDFASQQRLSHWVEMLKAPIVAPKKSTVAPFAEREHPAAARRRKRTAARDAGGGS